ncbi:ankyrin repeat-containing domain protein [Kalaharituber pfeilii]|nr:ankyrin repeat-containing domain protein [Kalaharituber pfeilii]
MASLHLAAQGGRVEVLKQLLAAGAQVNIGNKDGKTPLHLAAEMGHAEFVQQLIAAGAEVNRRDNGGRMPLLHAASISMLKLQNLVHQDALETIKVLLAKNALVGHEGCHSNHGFDKLSHATATLEQTNTETTCSIAAALKEGNHEIAQLLVEAYLKQANEPKEQVDIGNLATKHE